MAESLVAKSLSATAPCQPSSEYLKREAAVDSLAQILSELGLNTHAADLRSSGKVGTPSTGTASTEPNRRPQSPHKDVGVAQVLSRVDGDGRLPASPTKSINRDICHVGLPAQLTTEECQVKTPALLRLDKYVQTEPIVLRDAQTRPPSEVAGRDPLMATWSACPRAKPLMMSWTAASVASTHVDVQEEEEQESALRSLAAFRCRRADPSLEQRIALAEQELAQEVAQRQLAEATLNGERRQRRAAQEQVICLEQELDGKESALQQVEQQLQEREEELEDVNRNLLLFEGRDNLAASLPMLQTCRSLDQLHKPVATFTQSLVPDLMSATMPKLGAAARVPDVPITRHQPELIRHHLDLQQQDAISPRAMHVQRTLPQLDLTLPLGEAPKLSQMLPQLDLGKVLRELSKPKSPQKDDLASTCSSEASVVSTLSCWS